MVKNSVFLGDRTDSYLQFFRIQYLGLDFFETRFFNWKVSKSQISWNKKHVKKENGLQLSLVKYRTELNKIFSIFFCFLTL